MKIEIKDNGIMCVEGTPEKLSGDLSEGERGGRQ